MAELIAHHLGTTHQTVAGVMNGMADVFSGSPQVVTQVRRFAFDGLVALLECVSRLVQMITCTVDTVNKTIGPLANPVLIGANSITGARGRWTILTHHQPQQPDRRQYSGNRVITNAEAQVGQERRPIALHEGQRLIEHLSWRKFAFQCINDVADARPLRVDFTLDGLRAFLRLGFEFTVHETFLRSASWSLFKASSVRSGLKLDGSNCFFPDCSMANPTIITTTPTISAASQGAMMMLRP